MNKFFLLQDYELDNFYTPEMKREMERLQAKTDQLRQERKQSVAHIKSLFREMFGTHTVQAA